MFRYLLPTELPRLQSFFRSGVSFPCFWLSSLLHFPLCLDTSCISSGVLQPGLDLGPEMVKGISVSVWEAGYHLAPELERKEKVTCYLLIISQNLTPVAVLVQWGKAAVWACRGVKTLAHQPPTPPCCPQVLHVEMAALHILSCQNRWALGGWWSFMQAKAFDFFLPTYPEKGLLILFWSGQSLEIKDSLVLAADQFRRFSSVCAKMKYCIEM